MFETVQIARRHLLRYEYPDLRCAVETSASWSTTFLGSVGGWFATPPRSEEPEGEEPDEEEGSETFSYYGWPSYPY